MMQEQPVKGKGKGVGHLMQVADEISDNKSAPDSPFFCFFSCDLSGGRRTVDTGYLKPETCQVNRIIACTASKINGPAWPDFPALYKIDRCIRWCPTIPGDFIQRYVLVNPVDVDIFHACYLDGVIGRLVGLMFPGHCLRAGHPSPVHVLDKADPEKTRCHYISIEHDHQVLFTEERVVPCQGWQSGYHGVHASFLAQLKHSPLLKNV
jgi:hypothetical protein